MAWNRYAKSVGGILSTQIVTQNAIPNRVRSSQPVSPGNMSNLELVELYPNFGFVLN